MNPGRTMLKTRKKGVPDYAFFPKKSGAPFNT